MSAGDTTLAGPRPHGLAALDVPGPRSSGSRRRLLVVYPSAGNRRSGELASRLCEAASIVGMDATAIPAPDLVHCEVSRIDGSTALVVDPDQCASSSPEPLARLTSAGFRGAVASGGVTKDWYRSQSALGLDFDAAIDVGFVARRSTPAVRGMRYRFLFNAPLPRERALIEAQKPPSDRPLSWALVASCSTERVRLADELLSTFGPNGFLFLPPPRETETAGGMLGPDGPRRVLERTTLSVCCSHDDFSYPESLWFMDAVRSGAVPCKIDTRPWPIPSGAPRVHATLRALEDELTTRTVEELFEESRTYALAHGLLTDHLEDLLRDV